MAQSDQPCKVQNKNIFDDMSDFYADDNEFEEVEVSTSSELISTNYKTKPHEGQNS